MAFIFIKTFFAVFGVMDPVGNVPLFLALTGKLERKERAEIAKRAVWRAALILLIFTLIGNAILDVFRISIASFRIAGGLVLVLIGLEILFGFSLRKETGETHADISTVPLATPLIAGPGMITTAIILAKEYGVLPTLAGVAVNLALSYVLFIRSDLVLKALGEKGALIFAKFMGLILMAMGVEFIRNGFGM